MDIDPLDSANAVAEERAARDRTTSTWVALTVAVLASFLGICKVKDDNIVQAMQQAQADKLDSWSFYQARNLREEVAAIAADELKLSAERALPADLPRYQERIASYEQLALEQAKKKAALEKQAEDDDRIYASLNYRDDQFDLSDAAVAVAISLLALTALTHKRWLYWLALLPAAAGVLIGIAGLAGWHLHPDALTQLLS
jgi:hypothetical protein